MKPPCKRDCPKLTAGCGATCPEWAEYVEQRNKRYAERISPVEVYSMVQSSDKLKRYVNYRHKLGK